MSSSHDNKLKLRSLRRLKSYIATFSRPHLCVIPPTLVGWLFKKRDFLRCDCLKVVCFKDRRNMSMRWVYCLDTIEIQEENGDD